MLPVSAGGEAPKGIAILIPALPDLIWSAVCLVIIAIVLWRVMPRFTAILDQRAALIEGRIDEAAKLEEQSKALLAQQTEELTAARTEANEIRESARSEGTQIVTELKQHAQAEADRILANASRQIDAERQQVVVALREDIGRLASDLAGKIVGESLADPARQARLIDSFLDELDAEADAGEPSGAAPKSAGQPGEKG